MRKTKVLLILFLILFISIIPFRDVHAHSVDLDPEELISFPWFITNGQGTLSIDESQTNYSLYYQAIEIPDTIYNEIQEIETNGKAALEALNVELENLQAESNNLKTIYDEAYDEWQSITDAEEKEIAEAAYLSAQTDYENKVTEYNNKVLEYNSKAEEISNNIKALVPTYIESNWIKTEDGNFSIDLSSFSGNKAFAIWSRLVTSDGTTFYDQATYTMSGSKVEETAVESISLDKTTLNITEGSNYTLIATITPSDATNKLIIWSSDNESVAKVEDGKITAISEGTATITATTKDGNHTATCKVTVTKQDSTVATNELPKTGNITFIIMALSILSLIIIGFITYKKVKYLNFK